MTTKNTPQPKKGYAYCFYTKLMFSQSTARRLAKEAFRDATVSIVTTSTGFYLGINCSQYELSTGLGHFIMQHLEGFQVFHNLNPQDDPKRLFDGARLDRNAVRKEVNNETH